MQLIDGKKISQEIYHELKQSKPTKRKLAIVLANDDPASRVYVNLKTLRAKELGIEVELHEFDKQVTAADIVSQNEKLNLDEEVGGILIQLPLYKHLESSRTNILNTISSLKDVDGLTAMSQSDALQLGPVSILPATVEAILECINETNPKRDLTWDNIRSKKLNLEDNFVSGKNIVIINNSNLIGKPLANLLMNLNASVTVLNKHTVNLQKYTKDADILVSATGQVGLINASMLKEGATVVDVTSMKVGDEYKGDVVHDDSLSEKIGYFTPVPGGVGPVTVACLLRNFIRKQYF